MNKFTLFFLILVAGALGGCFGNQEIEFESNKIVYTHGGFFSFGVLVVRGREFETHKVPEQPAMGAGALGN